MKPTSEVARAFGAGRSRVKTRLRLHFGLRETSELTGICVRTLRSWMKKGWLVPAFKSMGGRGVETQLSGWTVVALTLIAGEHRDARERHEYIGGAAVRAQLAELAQRDDAELVSEELQDPRTSERVAALANESMFDPHLAEDTEVRLGRLLRKIDKKAETRKHTQPIRREPGEQV